MTDPHTTPAAREAQELTARLDELADFLTQAAARWSGKDKPRMVARYHDGAITVREARNVLAARRAQQPAPREELTVTERSARAAERARRAARIGADMEGGYASYVEPAGEGRREERWPGQDGRYSEPSIPTRPSATEGPEAAHLDEVLDRFARGLCVLEGDDWNAQLSIDGAPWVWAKDYYRHKAEIGLAAARQAIPESGRGA